MLLRRRSKLVPTLGVDPEADYCETFPDIDWAVWAEQERERARHIREAQQKLYRPSVWLPRELVERCDRIASTYGMTRTEYLVAAIEHYQRHWRPCPPSPGGAA